MNKQPYSLTVKTFYAKLVRKYQTKLKPNDKDTMKIYTGEKPHTCQACVEELYINSGIKLHTDTLKKDIREQCDLILAL